MSEGGSGSDRSGCRGRGNRLGPRGRSEWSHPPAAGILWEHARPEKTKKNCIYIRNKLVKLAVFLPFPFAGRTASILRWKFETFWRWKSRRPCGYFPAAFFPPARAHFPSFRETKPRQNAARPGHQFLRMTREYDISSTPRSSQDHD